MNIISRSKHRSRPKVSKRSSARRRMLESLEPRCLLASLGGEVFIDADGNGSRGSEEVGAAEVRVYIDANDNATFEIGERFTTTNDQGQYQFENLSPGAYNIRVVANGKDQTSPRVYFGAGYTSVGDGSNTNPTQLFEMSEAGDVLPIGGPNGDRIHGLVRTNDGEMIGVNHVTDSIFSIDPISGVETLLAHSDQDLVAGLAYDSSTDTIYTLVREEAGLKLKTVNAATGEVRTPIAATHQLRAIDFGSTFYDIDTASKTTTTLPRQTLSPFASTLDQRSDGVIFGLQGNDLKQFDFPTAGSTGTTVSTLSTAIEAISFGANDVLFGVSTSPSTFHSIDPVTGVVSTGIPIQYEGASISGVTGFDIGPDGTHYLVSSTHLYTFDPSTGLATRAVNRGFPSSPIFTSLTVAQDGSLFATLFSTTTKIAEIDPLTGVATDLQLVDGGSVYASVVATQSLNENVSLLDLANVSDLTFDSANGRIVGFDNASDKFFEFTTEGVGTILSTASRPLDSWSLAFNGTEFVMFDNADVNKTSVINVDPDTGEISTGFQASSRIPTEALFYATRGNAAHRVAVADIDLVSLDFGVTRVQPTFDIASDFPTVISELVLDPLFGSRDTDQLLEFRGLPGGQLNPNTYFVVVNEENIGRGEINEIFDLSNQPLGENGYLVVSQQGSPHSVNPLSTLLQGTTDGFGGIAGDLFSTIDATGNRIGSVLIESNGYFLIESNVRPQIGDDIDVDDDGRADIDGVKSNWKVLDSVSVHPFVGFGDQAYGQILLAEQELSEDPTTRTVEPGTPIVVLNGSGYAARIGESVGSAPDDWIAGTPVELDTDRSEGLLELYSFGPHLPEPVYFLERQLDHFGEANFVGGVRGTILTNPAIGESDPDALPPVPVPAVGVTILADENENGIQDTNTFSVDPNIIAREVLGPFVDPNAVLPEIPLTGAFPGVTISTAGSDREPINFEVRAVRERNTFVSSSNFVFSHVGIDFFNENRKLRLDFYRPASEVSIVALGSSTGVTQNYGRLEAYNANDELIGTVLSNALLGPNRQTLSIVSESEDIAYAVAYSDESIAGASPFGRFDNFSYKQSEATAVTDENGKYEIKSLFPGQYDITIAGTENQALIGIVPQRINIEKYENFVVGSTIRSNTPPQVASEFTFVSDENVPAGTSLGLIVASDPDGQQLTYEIIGENSRGLLINSETGELLVGPESSLNFEQAAEFTLQVSVRDPFAVRTTTVTVTLNDLNEAPVVEPTTFLVTEGTPSGTSIGQVSASDPDEEQDQTVTFAIVGGPDQTSFSIDATTGLITLINGDAINFEVDNELHFTVRVTDNADLPLSTEFDQLVRVVDQNDAPTIVTTAIDLSENPASSFVGQLQVNDPDLEQSHTFMLLGGTGAGLFEVSESGVVEVREGVVIDFEQGDSYTLRVRTVDSGAPPLSAETTVVVTIVNVNEFPILTSITATLSEDATAGQTVATLTTTDPDGGDTPTTITLLSGGAAANFTIDPETGVLSVAAGADLDFETKPTQIVHLRISTDDPVASQDVDFTIDLTDANDPPVVTTEQVVLSELALPGTIVGTGIQTADPDSNDRVTLAIVGGNAADRFVLDRTTGVLRVAEGASFDADVISDPLVILVEATDEGGLSSTRAIRVILNGVNEAPYFVGAPPVSSTIESGAFFELVIPSDAIVDPEGRFFSIAFFDQNGQLPAWLSFDAQTRTLSGLATPNVTGVYNMTLRALEPGPLDLFSDQTFTVTVQAGNEALTNKRDRLDVDANNLISPVDALRVINYLGRYGNGTSISDLHPFSGFVDTSGDGFVTAIDALLVINGLRISLGSSEQIALPSDDPDRDEVNDEAISQYLLESSLF